MDNLEGEIPDEEIHNRALWHDILSADLDSEDVLLLNIRQHRVFGVAHNVGCFVCGECNLESIEAAFQRDLGTLPYRIQ